jgi:transketolase
MTPLKETRFAYGEALLKLGEKRPEIVVLDADLYKSTRTILFRDAFPGRFIDMGISEADMISTAAGMAATGLIPFCNSFAIFVTGICYIPIRTQIAYPSLPVKIIGSSAGLTEGPDGASHQSLEDISLMRGLPNMVVLSPADEVETELMTYAIADWNGPVYMRLGRYPVPRLYEGDYQFKIGKASFIQEKGEIAIFATGHMVWKAVEALELLAQKHVQAKVINISTIKPLDKLAVRQAVSDTNLAVSIEEHSIIGGLGSAIAECITEIPGTPPLLRLGIEDQFGESGLADELLQKHGLQPEPIAQRILKTLYELNHSS